MLATHQNLNSGNRRTNGLNSSSAFVGSPGSSVHEKKEEAREIRVARPDDFDCSERRLARQQHCLANKNLDRARILLWQSLTSMIPSLTLSSPHSGPAHTFRLLERGLEARGEERDEEVKEVDHAGIRDNVPSWQ